MCQQADRNRHHHPHIQHSHDHEHVHTHPHNHASPEENHSTRRDFLRVLMAGALSGASILELAYHRAAWARGAAPSANANLFDLHKVADGVLLRPGPSPNSHQLQCRDLCAFKGCGCSRCALQALGSRRTDRPDQTRSHAEARALRHQLPFPLGSHAGQPCLSRQ